MKLKKAVRSLHLYLGLISGLVVFIVAVTGCIYAFERELKLVFYKDLFVAHPNSSIMKRSPEEIVNVVKQKFPKEKIKNIFILNDANRSIQVNLKNKLSVFVDPYTAAVNGTLHQDNSFFGVVLQVHRRLYLGEAGEIITGSSAFIFLFIIISGIILWWPKKKFTKQKFSLLRNASLKRRLFDLHSVLGFYASWIIIFTVLTGLIWSFKWVENSMYAMAGSKKERKQIHSVYSDSTKASLNAIFIESKNLCPDFKDMMIAFPEDSLGSFRVNIHYSDEGFFKKQHQLFFDRYSGEILKTQLYENTSTGDKIKATNYDIHTGRVFGLLGQLLVFFATLITASLPITGFMMWLNKRKKKNTAMGEELDL